MRYIEKSSGLQGRLCEEQSWWYDQKDGRDHTVKGRESQLCSVGSRE